MPKKNFHIVRPSDNQIDITPYDTGKRLEAKPWLPLGTAVTTATPEENFGRVDFDDETGETVATVFIERRDDGEGYDVWIENHVDVENLGIVIVGDDLVTAVHQRPRA